MCIVPNWFNANKLSLNVKKTKYSFFRKSSKKDNIPLRLPNLNINGLTVERESSIQFLGVWIDENLTWRDHNLQKTTIKNLQNYDKKFMLNFCKRKGKKRK